ncbi:EpsG family protein, partial [Klebsiella pneumoniae]
MFIYFLILLFLLLSIFLKRKYDTVTFFISVVILFLVGFLRGDNVGTDIGIYTCNFKQISFNPATWNYCTKFEDGFNYLIAFYKDFVTKEPTLFFRAIFIFAFFGFVNFIRKESDRPILTLFFFYIFHYYFYNFNIMRQFLGLGIILGLYPYVKTKTSLLFITIATTAFLFHNTLFILLFLLIFKLNWSEALKKKKLLLIPVLLSYCLFILKGPVISFAHSIYFLSERYTMHLRGEAAVDSSTITITLHTLFCLFCIFISSKNTPREYLFSYVLGIFILNVMGTINPLFIRVANCFLIFNIIYYTYLWYHT